MSITNPNFIISKMIREVRGNNIHKYFIFQIPSQYEKDICDRHIKVNQIKKKKVQTQE